MLSEDAVAEFAGRRFVKHCLREPQSPNSVLSFMFGVEYEDTPEFGRMMHSGHAVTERRSFWFAGSSSLDELCQPFRPIIRLAGEGALHGVEWTGTVDGVMAQLLLCDQLSRSVFRGTDGAFEFDGRSLILARTLSDNLLVARGSIATPLVGTFYIPYVVFLLTAFMHSEDIEDHAALARVLDYADRRSPTLLKEWFGLMRRGGEAHTRVVERFGRYPHRNAAKGRVNTVEEEAWLADVENLPSWARSQTPGTG